MSDRNGSIAYGCFFISPGMSAIGFYDSRAWRRKRAEVLHRQNYECQLCKAKGKYAKAVVVHHRWHYDQYPEYALSDFVCDQPNLVAVCRACHEAEHPGRLRPPGKPPKPPLTEEWW